MVYIRNKKMEWHYVASFVYQNRAETLIGYNSRTVGILDGSLFGRIKENAVFIDTGRSAQVVEADLTDALKRVPSRSTLLDVTFSEPPEVESELCVMKNVFLTPHIAESLGNEVHRMGEYMLEEYRRYAA